MDKDNMSNDNSNTFDNNSIIDKVTSVVEKLHDIQNVVQLLEVSLASNRDDESIIRTVQIINRMVGALIEHECKELIRLCSDCESI